MLSVPSLTISMNAGNLGNTCYREGKILCCFNISHITYIYDTNYLKTVCNVCCGSNIEHTHMRVD